MPPANRSPSPPMNSSMKASISSSDAEFASGLSTITVIVNKFSGISSAVRFLKGIVFQIIHSVSAVNSLPKLALSGQYESPLIVKSQLNEVDTGRYASVASSKVLFSRY